MLVIVRQVRFAFRSLIAATWTMAMLGVVGSMLRATADGVSKRPGFLVTPWSTGQY
jgi:hypothetical protein